MNNFLLGFIDTLIVEIVFWFLTLSPFLSFLYPYPNRTPFLIVFILLPIFVVSIHLNHKGHLRNFFMAFLGIISGIPVSILLALGVASIIFR